ncbi:MAG: hypothetical protein HFJ51_06010 [Clostridia bacterium]|nr:hypothetical protein [Clostridia bacterium]
MLRWFTVIQIGLTKKDIPYFAQIIHIADVFDAIVTKRQYTTHVDISETLKLLIRDSQPTRQTVALDLLSSYSKLGKINSKILKVLFKVVIDDTLYEISCTLEYVAYLKEQLKRLSKIQKLDEKRQGAKRETEKDYYKDYMRILFEQGENYENYKQVYKEYENALLIKEDLIGKLKNEIEIIKSLKA